MTTPTRIFQEDRNGSRFTIERALFVTSRGGCGVRHIYQIDRQRVAKHVFETCLDVARTEEEEAAMP